jgi:hypothetical protein
MMEREERDRKIIEILLSGYKDTKESLVNSTDEDIRFYHIIYTKKKYIYKNHETLAGNHIDKGK